MIIFVTFEKNRKNDLDKSYFTSEPKVSKRINKRFRS